MRLAGLSALFVLALSSLIHAEESLSEQKFNLTDIDRTFTVEGKQFSFKETEEGIVSVWEGSVRASSQQIIIQTEHLELYLTVDDKVKSIKAGPEVNIELVEDTASANVSGSSFEYDFETQTGHVGNSVIELKANPIAFNLPQGYNYWIYILSDSADIIEGDLFVKNPKVRLNSLDNPEVEVRGKELSIRSIGKERRMRIKQVSVSVFGYKIFYYPWSYDKLLTKRAAGGFSSDPPKFGIGDGGFEIDQKFFYTFVNPPLKNKALVFRFDVFTNDRWYPEIMLSDLGEKRLWDLKYGFERLDDHQGDYVRVFHNPDFNFRFPSSSIFNNFTFSSGLDWGRIEEPKREVEESRFGVHASLTRKPIRLGNPNNTLNIEGDWQKQFYSNGDEYEVFTRSIGVRHIEKEHFSIAVTYYHRDDKGTSPFLHDKEEILDELKWRFRTHISKSWGGGLDARYDFEKSHFRDLELIATRIYDSFQMSIKWDFADKALKAEFGYPGML